MKVLLTGAFGNIGGHTIAELLSKGQQVRCFDLKNANSEAVAAKWQGKVEVVWGDITNAADVEKAVAGVDYILHLAAIIPPLSESNPKLAEAVNVGGMSNLIAAAKAQPNKPGMTFCSSIAVYGHRFDEAPPRKASEPPKPADNYGRQKTECEKLLRESGLPFVILRLAAVPPISLNTFDPIVFDINPKTRIEFVHVRDVALALANTVGNAKAQGKILLIGGGKVNQYIMRDWLADMMNTTGLGPFPDEVFGPNTFYTDWMDTEESQAILQYQRLTWKDYQKEIRALLGWRIFFVKLLRPLIRRVLFAKSPYYQQNLAQKKALKA